MQLIRGHLDTVLFFALATFLSLSSTVLFNRMISQINRKLPEHQKMSHFFMYPGAIKRVARAHRSFYPLSRLRVVLYACIVLGVLSLLASAWTTGLLP